MGKKFIKSPLSDQIMVGIFFIFLTAFALLCLFPLFNLLAVSFSEGFYADKGDVILKPLGFNTDSWTQILSADMLWKGLWNTLRVTLGGTFLSLLFSAIFAYPLSKSKFPFTRIIMFLVVFCFIFRYPIIPYFIAVKNYGVVDTLWSLVVTHLIVEMNVIIMRTFFRQIPAEMEEAAAMEGAGHFIILFRIYLPLSKAALASLGLFYAVNYWNLYMHPMLFVRKADLQPLQIILRNMLSAVESEGGGAAMVKTLTSANTLQAATIVFATIPIVIAYPFIQKYFAKGAMLGSVKG